MIAVQYGSKHANVINIALKRDAEWQTFTTKEDEDWLSSGYTPITEKEALLLLAQNEVLPSEEELEEKD